MSKDLNKTMDNSNVEEETKPYLKEFNFIITKKLKENHISAKTTDKLESEDLNWQCQEVNRNISNLTKCTQECIKKIEKLTIQIYQFNGSEAKILSSLKKTGIIITLIDQELNKFKIIISNGEKKKLSFEHRLNQIKNLLKRKQAIKKLEEIKQLSQGSINNDNLLLLKQHKELETHLKLMKGQLMAKQSNNNKHVELNARQIHMFHDVYMLQENNNAMKKNVFEKNKYQEAIQNEISNSTSIRLNELTKRKSTIKVELDKQIGNNKTCIQRIEDMKLDKIKIEEQLFKLKQEQTKKQIKIKEIEETYLDELQHSRELLTKADKNIRDTENQIFTSKKILSEKVYTCKDLQKQKEYLIRTVCEKKVNYLKVQCAHSQEHFKIDSLNEKLLDNIDSEKVLKMKVEEIEKNIINIKHNIGDNIKEFSEEKTKTINTYNENTKKLLNQQSYQEASIELMQNRFENSVKKIEKIKKDMKERESDIKWDEIKLEVQKGMLRTLRNKVQKQEELNKELIDKQAQTHNPSAKLILRENSVEIIESEDNQINNSSGRRSPGILKNIKSPKCQGTPTKKVKFEGIPSSDSSTHSDIKNFTAQKQLDKMSQDCWNKLVSDSKKNTSKPTRRN